MAIVVFAETQDGQFKKAALEAITYASKVGAASGMKSIALVLGSCEQPGLPGQYGADEVVHVSSPSLDSFDSQQYTAAIASVFEEKNGKLLILSHSSTGKSIAGRLSIRLKAGLVSGVNALPVAQGNSWSVVKPVFSGKALATHGFQTERLILSLAGNAIKPEKNGSDAPVTNMDVALPATSVVIRSVSRVKGTVPLPEAEVVVSGGRGFKGPENWGMLEELAHTLGATTACSRPVADAGWRPHHEHVGQTGIAIRPNLYFAIGISGAIQHLAGVNSSKVIVVINKDPEAPFFKAADYGVVGDLFEVVPKLTASLRKFKESNS